MLTSYKYEAKTEEEALNKCYQDLNVTREGIYFNVNETEKTLFKSKKVEIIVLKKEDIVSYIKDYIKNLGSLMSININIELRENEDVYNIHLVSENNAILIGKEGRTIDAVQHLLKQTIKVNTGFNIKINLDVSNYKCKKIDRIEYEVKKIIREVKETKLDVTLDPMNSYERRVVHSLVSKYEGLTTESVGEEPNRRIVIKYSEK